MAITREDLELFRQEKINALQELELQKQEDLKVLEARVAEYRQKLQTEVDHKHEVKSAELNAEIRILEQIIKKEEEL